MNAKTSHILDQVERLAVATEIVTNLKSFTNSNGQPVNLYNDDYTFIPILKAILNKYILEGGVYEGKLKFEEIDRNIEYYLPAKSHRKSLFVIKMR